MPGHDWVDLDPTNDLIPGREHITVGWGRDYGDVSPVSGVMFGGGEHECPWRWTCSPPAEPRHRIALARMLERHGTAMSLRSLRHLFEPERHPLGRPDRRRRRAGSQIAEANLWDAGFTGTIQALRSTGRAPRKPPGRPVAGLSPSRASPWSACRRPTCGACWASWPARLPRRRPDRRRHRRRSARRRAGARGAGGGTRGRLRLIGPDRVGVIVPARAPSPSSAAAPVPPPSRMTARQLQEASSPRSAGRSACGRQTTARRGSAARPAKSPNRLPRAPGRCCAGPGSAPEPGLPQIGLGDRDPARRLALRTDPENPLGLEQMAQAA